MDNIYESKILIMIVLKTFTCGLTGDELQIVRYNDGTEVCQPYTPLTEDTKPQLAFQDLSQEIFDYGHSTLSNFH